MGLDIKVLSENEEEIKLRESSEIEEPTDIRDIERKSLGNGRYEINYEEQIERPVLRREAPATTGEAEATEETLETKAVVVDDDSEE